MEFITYLQTRLTESLPDLINDYPGEIAVGSLSELEPAVKQMTQAVGNAVIQHSLEVQEGKYPADQVTCPHCGGQADYVRRRAGRVITLQGRVYYRRAYYGCGDCEQGHFPLDERLGIQPGQMSEAGLQVAALPGIHEAFGTSSDVRARTTLLELSPHSIRKACQVMGERVMAHEDTLRTDSQALERQREHARQAARQRVCGSMEGFRVLFEDGWHEMKGGAWWTVDEQGEAHDIRYYVDTTPAEGFSDLVWATGFERRLDPAEEVVLGTDGAEWIERLITQHFPHAIQIIDWYHACEYLAPVALWAGKTAAQPSAWLETVTTDLWEGHVDQVIKPVNPSSALIWPLTRTPPNKRCVLLPISAIAWTIPPIVTGASPLGREQWRVPVSS